MAEKPSETPELEPDLPGVKASEVEDPAPRAQPLQHSEKSDVGCLVLLFLMFVGVFFVPALFLLGGAPLIIPLITILLLGIATPFVNPVERYPGAVKWWGRILSFLFMAGLVVAFILWLRSLGDTLPISDS